MSVTYSGRPVSFGTRGRVERPSLHAGRTAVRAAPTAMRRFPNRDRRGITDLPGTAARRSGAEGAGSRLCRPLAAFSNPRPKTSTESKTSRSRLTNLGAASCTFRSRAAASAGSAARTSAAPSPSSVGDCHSVRPRRTSTPSRRSRPRAVTSPCVSRAAR